MHITSELTDAAVLKAFGTRMARYRIEANLTQTALAEQAGIGKRTLERIEAGHGTALVSLVRILRVLHQLDGLDRLLPELPPSPIEQLKRRGRQRRRVSRGRQGRAEHAPAGPWTWADQKP